MILPHDDQLFAMTCTKIWKNRQIVEPGGALLVVDEGLGQVGLLLNQTLGIDQQLLQG